MSNKRGMFVGCLALGLVVLMVAMAMLLEGAPTARAGPQPAPTPATYSGGADPDYVMVTFVSGAVSRTATFNSSGFNLPSYNAADICHTVDINAAQSISCLLQFSNDNTNWADGVYLFTTTVADASATMQQYNTFGRYVRTRCVLTSANPATLTIVGKIHK